MKINVGDYVRTKKYGIAKIISNSNDGKFNVDLFKKDGITLRCLKEKDIIKSSPNIIDLVEAGDYVNGLPVRFIEKDNGRIDIGQCEDYFWIKNKGIKEIITREQIEQVSYKVGEE